jgi:uncharacterized membrane protein YhaH (DUF805 family)
MMDLQTAVETCFAKYATFRGRASRSEFWYFALVVLIADRITGVFDDILFPENFTSPLNAIFWLAAFLPSLAVLSRRLHDTETWQVLLAIPIIGWAILIVRLVQPGTRGPNTFGDDPLGSSMAVPT